MITVSIHMLIEIETKMVDLNLKNQMVRNFSSAQPFKSENQTSNRGGIHNLKQSDISFALVTDDI